MEVQPLTEDKRCTSSEGEGNESQLKGKLSTIEKICDDALRPTTHYSVEVGKFYKPSLLPDFSTNTFDLVKNKLISACNHPSRKGNED